MRWVPIVASAAAAAVSAGCGGGGSGPTASARARGAGRVSSSGASAVSSAGAGAATGSPSGRFAWLRPAPAPTGWRVARLSSGATLSYPPAWRAVRGDRGTASAATFDAAGRYLGYLNLTPRQGAETLAAWSTFRLRHNAEEGDVQVRADGDATGLRFRTGHGTCVQDSYTTSAATTYEEVACLVAGRHASSVIVGAAPRERWSRERAQIERAISAMTT